MPSGKHTKDPVWRAAQSERLKGNDCAHGKLKDARIYEGEKFGAFKVIKFLRQNISNRGGKKRDYYYEVECTICGNKREMTLLNLQKRYVGTEGLRCANCDSFKEDRHKKLTNENVRQDAMDAFIKNDKANINNASTGIKHMSSRVRKNGTTEYRVYVAFDGKQTLLLSTINYDKAKILAGELNDVLKSGGKEAFYKWYKNIESVKQGLFHDLKGAKQCKTNKQIKNK